MAATEGNTGLRLLLLVGGTLLASGLGAALSVIVAIALSSGKGAGGAGDVMMVVLALLALAMLATLPVVFLLAKRWSGRAGLAIGLALLAGAAHAACFVVTFFVMAVVLNR